ncbi:cyclic nucleotide-binding protein [Herbaspirillum sp. VT-16-41]|nr:cyclic nucleotide-binding protein [Herbaspirillum sp. VT-16-41]
MKGEIPASPSLSKLEALQQTPWFSLLERSSQQLILNESKELEVEAGSFVLRAGDSPVGWFSVLEGLLKWSAIAEDGRSVSMAGFSPGSWFGEASLVRGEPYDYHAIALRKSRVLIVPQSTCHQLFREQIAFSNAVMRQLAERVNYFMGTFSAQILSNMEVKIAQTLASMFNKELHPRRQPHLGITQEELANLCGVSRQRCNLVLNRFARSGMLTIEYAGITVIDLERLRSFSGPKRVSPK